MGLKMPVGLIEEVNKSESDYGQSSIDSLDKKPVIFQIPE